ncbi:hypothetical protein UlMin_036675 [Ulmus minor]
MALENCLQVSSICSTRVGSVQSHHTLFSSTLQPFHNKGLKKAVVALSFSSSFPHSNSSTARKQSLFVCKAREAVDQVQVVNESSWDNLVVSSEKPVLVEFWAPWCGPCRMIAPVIDELAKEYVGKIDCFKLNTDDSPNIATKYGIRSIPTVLFFKDGEKKESVIGAVPKSTLSSTIEKYVEP